MSSMKQLREQVFERCGGRCELCGMYLEDSYALHHRKLRSRGGQDTLANLVALHHKCHNLGTDSVHLKPELATRRGFIVASWEEPEGVPLHLHTTTWVILANGYTPIRRDEE